MKSPNNIKWEIEKWKQFNCSIFKKINQKLNGLSAKHIFKEFIDAYTSLIKLCIYYHILMHIYGTWKDGTNESICREAMEAQT